MCYIIVSLVKLLWLEEMIICLRQYAKYMYSYFVYILGILRCALTLKWTELRSDLRV